MNMKAQLTKTLELQQKQGLEKKFIALDVCILKEKDLKSIAYASALRN